MTGNIDRIGALGRIAILTSASEENHDGYVEVTAADMRALLDEHHDLTDKLAVATRTAASLAAQRDAMQAALNKANAELHSIACCGDTDGAQWRPHPASAERHFSPGYEGEKPDHHGPRDTCAMPACVQSRAQHKAAANIQDITAELFADNPSRAFPKPDWLIWSHEHAGWWRPFERGYTSDLAEAGRYIHPRAYQICCAANHYDSAWAGGVPPEVMIAYTDDPQGAAAAVRKATAEWVADRAARTDTTGI